MQVSQPANSSKRPGHKWKLAIGAAVAVAVLYTGGWYFTAAHLREKLLSALAGQDDKSVTVDCRQMKTGGFPLSMSLSCASIEADDVEHGISTTLGPAQARVSLLTPNTVSSRFTGPAEIRSANGMLTGEWESLSTDVDFGLGGMQSILLQAMQPRAHMTDPGKGNGVLVTASRLTSAIDGKSGDLQANLKLDGTTITRNGVDLPLPPLAIDAAIQIAGRGDLIGRFDRQSLYGTNGDIQRFTANLGEGRDISITGPFEVDGEGRLSGTVRLEAKNIAAWLEAVRQAVPEAASVVETAGSLIRSYTKGSPDLALDLTIKRGRIFVAGFIPVGEIPPL